MSGDHGNVCPECGGAGFEAVADYIGDCPTCHGEGVIVAPVTEHDRTRADIFLAIGDFTRRRVRSLFPVGVS